MPCVMAVYHVAQFIDEGIITLNDLSKLLEKQP